MPLGSPSCLHSKDVRSLIGWGRSSALPSSQSWGTRTARPTSRACRSRNCPHSSGRQQQPSKWRSHRCCRGNVVTASAASASGAGSLESGDDRSSSQSISAFVGAFWKFLRPHTIRGTILGSTAVTARALLENPQCIDWTLLPRALMGVLALICGNGFIVGLNQIYDVSIDQVNKPFLPIAAGELSTPVAWVLVAGLAAAGVSIVALNFGRLITYLYSFGLTLGAVYSAPPFHLKRFPVAAFLIIATVRGFLLNFGVYHAVRAALGLPFVWAPATCFITVFVTVFAVVIAITKDLADVEGDRKHNINTFATSIGVRGIAFLGAGLLLANYAGAAILALRLRHAFNLPVMLGAHGLMAAFLIANLSKLESSGYNQKAIIAFYQSIWNLFYLEYALFPFL